MYTKLIWWLLYIFDTVLTGFTKASALNLTTFTFSVSEISSVEFVITNCFPVLEVDWDDFGPGNENIRVCGVIQVDDDFEQFSDKRICCESWFDWGL